MADKTDFTPELTLTPNLDAAAAAEAPQAPEAPALTLDPTGAVDAAAAQKAKDNTRTVGFALTPCVIPEVGHSNFTLGENEMAMGMGIHGEPGVWNGPIKTADELAAESLDTLLKDMPLASGDEVALLINGLGATSIEELYILSNSVSQQLEDKGISIYRTFVGEFATSMEMMGPSISIMKVDSETKAMLDMPVSTPFYCQK